MHHKPRPLSLSSHLPPKQDQTSPPPPLEDLFKSDASNLACKITAENSGVHHSVEVATGRKMNSYAVVEMGPAGGSDVDKDDDDYYRIYKWDYPDADEITNILVWHDEVIQAIKFEYVKNGGGLVWSDLLGSTSSKKFNTVTIDGPSEYITGIRGHDSRGGGISSLSIITNLKTYGPFGKVTTYSDGEFEFQLGMDRRFGGFFGTLFHGDSIWLRSLGVYLKLSPPST